MIDIYCEDCCLYPCCDLTNPPKGWHCERLFCRTKEDKNGLKTDQRNKDGKNE